MDERERGFVVLLKPEARYGFIKCAPASEGCTGRPEQHRLPFISCCGPRPKHGLLAIPCHFPCRVSAGRLRDAGRLLRHLDGCDVMRGRLQVTT
jgi:hypothetical protein